MARPGSTTSETGNNYQTANGTGAAVRAKINEIFQALRTISSGSSDPSGAANIAQHQPHINTSTNELKIATSVSGDTATYVVLGKVNEANFGHVVAATPVMTGDVSMNSNGFLKIPVGTDAQQPGQSSQPAAAIGQFRYNSDQIDLKDIKIQVGESLVEVLELQEVAQIRCFWRQAKVLQKTIL